MNIVSKLTLRHLKLNKRRTLVTIIGVAISAAMITAVATLGISFIDLMKRQSISNNGEWHVLYKNINKTQLEAINNDKETKAVVISRDVGYAPLNGSQNESKPYLFIREYNEKGFEKFPIELSEGRFPKAGDEIVISEAILTNAKVPYKIGDVVTLDIGNRYLKTSKDGDNPLPQETILQRDKGMVQEIVTKESTKRYKIVGVIKRPTWEPISSPGFTVLSYLDENTVTSKNVVDAAVIVKNIQIKIIDHANELAKRNGIVGVGFNYNLLRYYGVMKDDSLRNVILTLSTIVMTIIMIGSVSLIYNAFAISVSERLRHLGMLSSVGATKKQKRDSVFFEGAAIGAISIPLGIICGILGMGLTFLCINSMIQGALGVTESFRLVISPASLLLAVAVSTVTIFISTYIPAVRASKVSAIDAIRQTADVKLTGREVRTSMLTRKIFGIEGEIGLKNLKRNKGRYKATVFSLVVSLVLFLTMTFFLSGLEKSLRVGQQGTNFDIRASILYENAEEKEKVTRKIISLGHITEFAYTNSLDANSLIKKESWADYLKDVDPSNLVNGTYPYAVSIHALNDEALKVYAKEVGVDFNRLKDKEKPSAIVIDTVRYKDMQAKKYVETKAIKTSTGQKLDLGSYNWETKKFYDSLGLVEIVARTDKTPMGLTPMGEASAIFDIITSKDTFDKIVSHNETASKTINTQIFLKSDDPLKLQEDIEAIQYGSGATRIDIRNVFMERQKEEQRVLLFSVFTYGFIFLITSIGIANIFNTISTSIVLRKKEFAMLKSVGMTPESFSRMINYESIFYGIKALLYGLPISLSVMYLMYRTFIKEFDFAFTFPWVSIGAAVVAIFVMVGAAMRYSSSKIKKGNIIEALKQEIA